MQATAPSATFIETEIKLALPVADPADMADWVERVVKAPALARRKAVRQQVYSVYYDTPEQALRGQRAALRLRRVGPPEQPQWLQTLKTAGHSDSALSQRGEWEMPVPGPALVLESLHDSPWPQMDRGGAVSAKLQPCFVTDFERITWHVKQRDGSAIEVALDVGTISADGRSTPVCELELELLAGPPSALFALAQRLARSVAVLPLAASKAQRGYALLQTTAPSAVRAHPPQLSRRWTVAAIARRALGEMFLQFTANLHHLQSADDPELVHQARVGWRRFRSLWRLLRPALAHLPLPDGQALKPLLERMGALRDLDVALTQTLPAWADLYVQGDAARTQHWQALQALLAQATQRERVAVRQALAQPAVGQALLALTHWLETLDGPLAAPPPQVQLQVPARKRPAQRWVRGRTQRLADRLEVALHEAARADVDMGTLHRARILAKRLRYSTEVLAVLLPGRLQRSHTAAGQWQERLGTARDLAQASVLAAQLGAPAPLVEFLRGVAVGHAQVLTLEPAASA